MSALRIASVTFGLLAVFAGCRSGSDPSQRNTAPTPENHPFPIASGPHAVDCNVCHGDFSTFREFSCVACHANTPAGHDQSTTDRLHGSLSGYAYQSPACYSCHKDGAAVPFDHPGITGNCAQCHATAAPFAAFPTDPSQHPPIMGADCAGCHGTKSWKTLPGPAGAVSDPAQTIAVDALIPSYAGTSIVSVSPQTESLPMPMVHTAAEVPASVSCAGCHDNAGSGSYFPGNFHSSLANLDLAQPTTCTACHATSMPTGFVGPLATDPARSPASGEMKHDAVIWQNDAPTSMPAVAQDCGVCHQGPSRSSASTWAANAAADGSTARPSFHDALARAAQPQPVSCLDCHANSRPGGVLTAANAALPAKVTVDHGALLSDCASCHTSGAASDWTAWKGGRYHLAGSQSPKTCLPCHGNERPSSTDGWISTTYTASPFDYGTNAQGITHGAGQDCALCHSGPGTGSWGGQQNWAGGQFAHGDTTIAKTTCIACHASQRPDLQAGATAAGMATLLGFDHALNGTGDCVGCHQATVTAGTYVNYVNPTTHKLPDGDWRGGQKYPGSIAVGSATKFITVTSMTLQRSGAKGLITGMSSTSATLYDQMLHVSAALPAALNAGPSNNPDDSKCWHCHTSTGTTVTSYADGRYHPALTGYAATPGGPAAPFPQPTGHCGDCHVPTRPPGIVERAASPLQPMDHAAEFTAPVTIAGVSVTGVAGIECAVCHRAPGDTWTDGVFHANVAGAVPKDCTACHYPLMANAAVADTTSGALYTMKHASSQMAFQACEVCHTAALGKATQTPVAAAAWRTGALHPTASPQPAACLECHAVSLPAAATPSTWTYALAAGGTGSNEAQWMSHSVSTVAGVDCAACHAGDARASGSAWSTSVSFHDSVSPTTCQGCHGLGNGSTVPGTKNNLPAGLTASSVTTSADAASGVAAGTHDQISHADVNVTGHDCNFCHTQVGRSTAPGVMGQEWAQGRFHANFGAGSPLVMNGSSGRCSNCHLNVKPPTGFTAIDHGPLSAASGSQDCSSCHAWPGTGTPAAPNWLGAAGAPPIISVGGFTVPSPPAPSPTTQGGISGLPHPTVGSGTTCTTCHTSASGGKKAIGYDHASSLANSNCNACHEAGSDLVGTPWNGATSAASGAGDTRPFTLTSIVATYKGDSLTVKQANHFYPVDCSQCHIVPAGNGQVTTGTAYTTAWKFPHTTSKMTNPSTCVMCHTKGIPD